MSLHIAQVCFLPQIFEVGDVLHMCVCACVKGEGILLRASLTCSLSDHLNYCCYVRTQGSHFQQDMRFAIRLLGNLISFVLRLDFGVPDPLNQLHVKPDR